MIYKSQFESFLGICDLDLNPLLSEFDLKLRNFASFSVWRFLFKSFSAVIWIN